MTLQGPHQVAKASRTTILLSLSADWNSALLCTCQNLSIAIKTLQAERVAALDALGSGRNVLGEIVDTHFDS